MRKYVKDPNSNTNQYIPFQTTSSSGNIKLTSEDRHGAAAGGGSVMQAMADSYAKRQMFYYGVDDPAYQGGYNGG